MTNHVDVDLKQFIRDIPDFPKPGILFRDISPLLGSPRAFAQCIRRLAEPYRQQPIDVVVAAEARGFIFGAPLALEFEAAFVPIRKPGKLPGQTETIEYELEYGRDAFEMHLDAVTSGQRVLVVDDLLATGGTVRACCDLLVGRGVEIVGCAFVIQLLALGGEQRIAPYQVRSLLQYT